MVLLVRFCVILLSEPKAPEVFSNPLAPEPMEEEEEEDDYSGYVSTFWLLDLRHNINKLFYPMSWLC